MGKAHETHSSSLWSLRGDVWEMGVGNGWSFGMGGVGLPCDTTMTNVLRGLWVQRNEAECDGDARVVNDDYGTDIASVLTFWFFFFFFQT